MSVNIHKSASKAFKDKEFVYKNDCNEEKFDIRGVKVLTKNDWNRLQYNIHKGEIEADKEQREKEKREKIKQCSQELVKDWSNTVLGARQKKLAERKLRLEIEEKERKEIDLAEALYQAEQRRKAIEEAKIKQYYQTDRVKNFHSALLHTEVLKEREAQIELKRLKQMTECNRDMGFQTKAQREFEEALKADQEKTAERIKKTKENVSFVKAQIKYNQEIKEREIRELNTEGENIRRLAVAHALEKQRLDQIEREERRFKMQEYMQQMDDVKKMKEIEKLKNEEDDEEIRIFAAAKKKMLKLRLAKEKELYDENQNSLEKIKNKLTAQLKLKMDDEDLRIRNAITEKEEKFQNDEADKDKKRQDTLKSIEDHRKNTMKTLEEEQRLNKQRDLDSLMARKEADSILKENEDRRQKMRLVEAKKLAQEHLATTKALKDSDENSMTNKLKIMQENQKLLDLEEKVFQDYAKKVIEHCEKGGRNTYPLKVAAARGVGGGLGPVLPGGSVRPSYQSADGKAVELANWQTNDAKDIKDVLNCDSTSDNLGFVWKQCD